MNELLERAVALTCKSTESEAAEALLHMEDRFGADIPVSLLEEMVKIQKKQLKQILGKDLLEWMQENDQTSFETEDVKVSIKTYVSAKMLDPIVGFKWLTEHQYGDLIKDNLEFPKGELTPEAEGKLEELGLSYVKKSGIHPQSLKKIISDRLKAGEELPWSDDDDIGDGIKVGYFDECVVKEK